MLEVQAEIGIDIKSASSGEDRAGTAVLKNGYLYAGVFDGHNGHTAASWCAENFPRLLEEQYDNNEPTSTALKNAFNIAHASICGPSGTTATVIITQGNYVAIAHVGDSRAILFRGGHPIELTADHKLSLPSERSRIEEAAKRNPKEIFILGQRVQGLMLTRSIGDKTLTKEILSDPVVREFHRKDEDDFVVAASDGLWDIMSTQSVFSFVRNIASQDPQDIAEQLTHHARTAERDRNVRRDDVTCVVIGFKNNER